MDQELCFPEDNQVQCIVCTCAHRQSINYYLLHV
jgi:hypothetical protein